MSYLKKLYLNYRAWARSSDRISLYVRITLGLCGAVVVTILRSAGAIHSVLPWLVMGLGIIASLDAVGAALDRRSKIEAAIRFVMINAICFGIGFWLLSL